MTNGHTIRSGGSNANTTPVIDDASSPKIPRLSPRSRPSWWRPITNAINRHAVAKIVSPRKNKGEIVINSFDQASVISSRAEMHSKDSRETLHFPGDFEKALFASI